MEKEQFLKFKEDLKKEAKLQSETKRQRKTVNFQGERTMSPYTAQCECDYNRRRLDLLYTVYYIMKHRIEVTPETVEKTIASVYPKTHSGLDVKTETFISYNGEPTERFYTERDGMRDYYRIESFVSDAFHLYKEIVGKYGKIG